MIRRVRRLLIALIAGVMGLAGCNLIPAAPTQTPSVAIAETAIPAVAGTPPVASPLPPPAQPETVWVESPFGEGGRVAVLHYTADGTPNGTPCVRFLVETAGAQPHSRCANAGSGAGVVAVVSVERDPTNARFLIVAGRALNPAIRTVVIVMQDGESFPVSVDDGGFILILPGERLPMQAVPIDEFGNTIGAIYSF